MKKAARTISSSRDALVVAGLVALATIAVMQGPVEGRQKAQPGVQGRSAAASVPSCPELARALSAVVQNDGRLRDWAYLSRYRESNHALPPPQEGEARVVFMGDSITDFWQLPRFAFFPGKPYIDRGISGQTTPQMLVRFRPDVIALKPKAVVILAGTNDIAGNTGPATDEEIEGNLASMTELARAHGIRVVLASILPVSSHHRRPGDSSRPQTDIRPLSRIKAINERIKAYAAASGDVYLDYFSSMVDESGMLRADLSDDDLHPNARGYGVMTPLAEAAIARALK